MNNQSSIISRAAAAELRQQIDARTAKIAVIGLGYVGLPLAVEFGKQFETIGFDINQKRVDELSAGTDHTLVGYS